MKKTISPAKKINASINSINDLANKTSGVITSSTGQKYITQVNYKSKEYKSFDEAGMVLSSVS